MISNTSWLWRDRRWRPACCRTCAPSADRRSTRATGSRSSAASALASRAGAGTRAAARPRACRSPAPCRATRRSSMNWLGRTMLPLSSRMRTRISWCTMLHGRSGAPPAGCTARGGPRPARRAACSPSARGCGCGAGSAHPGRRARSGCGRRPWPGTSRCRRSTAAR